MLKSKTEVSFKLIEYTKMIERQTGKRLKCVRTDNGSEFCNKKFDSFCLQHGILHQTMWSAKPLISHMRVFGSRGFVYVDSSKRSKFDPKAHRCIFLEYAENSKEYSAYDIDDQRVVISLTIALDERPPVKYVPVPISQSLQYT
ncbi:hypothetical protein PsorP6_006810 [Peronosclerospora sorghi]|uniref:Uncharacterized protein n=1 Tax=Peronosclerospora sorghi TaxID=230839 RepID=A0ACC0WBH4_9STRA|nr:hypothetical protein PsorP6_006810 [Peronosclerospora sorghi]